MATHLVAEWQTKQICWFIGSAVVGVKQNKLPDLASKIKLVPDKDRNDVGVTEADRTADPAVFVEEGSQIAADRNKQGSMERLLVGLREMPPPAEG